MFIYHKKQIWEKKREKFLLINIFFNKWKKFLRNLELLKEISVFEIKVNKIYFYKENQKSFNQRKSNFNF